MCKVKFTGQFKKDLKLAKKQGKNLDTLFNVIKILEKGEKLDDKYRDHSLSGKYKMNTMKLREKQLKEE